MNCNIINIFYVFEFVEYRVIIFKNYVTHFLQLKTLRTYTQIHLYFNIYLLFRYKLTKTNNNKLINKFKL